MPVYVAAYGPRVLRLAGRLADGLILQTADPETVEWAIRQFRRAAEEAGREPERMGVVVATACAVSDELGKARDEVRWYAAVVSNHALDLLRRYRPEELPPGLVKDMEAFRGKYDYEDHCRREAAHATYATDEMVDRLILVGDVKACLQKVGVLKALGVSQICLYLFGADKERLLKTFGEQIIPRFK